MAKLTILNHEFGGQSCELPDGTITVGRGPANMLVIANESVSTRHCELLVYGNEIIVRELASRNGTFVNGVRVQAQSPVLHRQVIRIGKIDLRLELSGVTDDSDQSTMTAVHALRPAQAPARPTPDSTSQIRFAPVGEPISESRTRAMPAVRPEPPAPAFSLPENTPAKAKSRAAQILVLVFILGIAGYLAGRFFAAR